MIIQWTTYRMPTACVMGLAAALCCATAVGVGAQGLAPGTWELKMAGSMFSLHANEARVSDVVSSIDAMIPADVHIGTLPDCTVSGTFDNLALDDLLDRMDVDYVLFYETGDTPDHAVLQRALISLEDCAIGAEFTIFAPGQENAAVAVLSAALRAGNANRVRVAATIQDALDGEADVLVLFLERHSAPRLASEAMATLRTRRVIGIGYGAAELFGALGLEIKGGACMHNTRDSAPEIQVEANVDYSNRRGQQFTAFRLDEEGEQAADRGVDHYFAMFLPRKHQAAQFIEAIARWPGNENYAPVVKQGNYIMVGLAAPPTVWTKEYRSFFADMAGALAKQAPVPFSKVKWETTAPGEYGFELAEGRSTTELYRRRFYFRFTKPTAFSATLEHAGSSSVMILFMGDNRDHWTRKDAKNGERLGIEADITAEDVNRIGEGYWSLKVTNFDRAARTTCRVKIEY